MSSGMPAQPDAEQAKPNRPAGYERLAEMIGQAGLVGDDVLNWARHESRMSGRKIHDLLVERVPVVERDLWRLVAQFMAMPFDDLTGRSRSTGLASHVPSQVAFRYHLAPVEMVDGVITVALARPETLAVLDEATAQIGSPVSAVLSPPSDLERYIQSLYGLGAETVDKLAAAPEADETPIRIIAAESHSIGETIAGDEQASITRFVNQILIQAIKDGASDVHIEPYESRLRVRFRIDGQLQEAPLPPTIKKFESSIISRVKVLGSLDIAEKRLCQDGQMRLVVLGRPIDVRISVLPTIYGEGVVLRLLDRQLQFRGLDTLGMKAEILDQYSRLLERPQGLILVTGPTGSGKTTTLYSSMTHVNRPRRKIITIEDPVEYRLEGVTQIQVKESIGLSFSNLLRNILRHDPDVIMIGEIRDAETANMALSAAMTGHLVFASLHTNDAPTTVARLRNMGVPAYLVAAGLEVVLAQRLVRRICPDCRQEEPPLSEQMLMQMPALRGRPVYRGAGCENCRYSGYQGRTGLYEFFQADDAIREMVLAGKSAAAMRDHAIAGGMTSLFQAGVELIASGVTTVEEVLRVTGDLRSTGGGAGQ